MGLGLSQVNHPSIECKVISMLSKDNQIGSRATWLLSVSPLSALICLIFLSASSLQVQAQATRSATTCDYLAAHPQDRSKVAGVAGVPMDSLDFVRAIPACEAAINSFPGDARLHFQLGRALQANKRLQEALLSYKRAVDLGSSMAAFNIGVLYDGVLTTDKKVALSWYEYAARGGAPFAKHAAAVMLESGDGLGGPDYERAATYWRSLAEEGDQEANERLGMALLDKRITSTHLNEMQQRLILAANSGRQIAALLYAEYLRNQLQTPETIQQGAKYALMAYKLSLSAGPETEESWPVYRWEAFAVYDGFVRAGAPSAIPSSELNQARLDSPSQLVKFTVPVDCSGTKAPFEVYIWQWSRPYPQTDEQAEWLRRARGCVIGNDVLDAFRKIYTIASANNVSFPELAQYAFAKQQSTVPTAQRTGPAPPSLSNDQTLVLGTAAVVGGAACWYWADRCKELAWELAKEGAKELLRKALR